MDAATVGIAENDPHALKIYPNPVREQLSIMVPENGNDHLLIVDMSGRVMLESDLTGEARQVVNVEALPTGMYGISLSSNQGIRSARFIKTN